MNELDLPPRRPLPDGTRDRALRTVLDGIDGADGIETAPLRRRTAPLVAAAVVVAVLGGIAAVALSTSGSDELRPAPPATAPTTAPVPFQPDVPISPTGDTGYVEPFERCKAAVTSNGHADAYQRFGPVETWPLTREIDVAGGVDRLLIIGNGLLCHVSPTTVRVSALEGTPLDDVELVMVAPQVIGVLNGKLSSVMWTQDGFSSTPSDAPVQVFQLDDGTDPPEAELSIVSAGASEPAFVAQLPGSLPEPLVQVVDRPLPQRDSSTPDGKALDSCVRPPHVRDAAPGQGGAVTGESEPRLWQPLSRFDLPGGGHVISATIGGDYAGLCEKGGNYLFWWSRVALPAEQPPGGSIHLATVSPPQGPPMGGLFGLGTDVVRVELTRADGSQVPCQVEAALALCVADDASGLLTLTLHDSAGGSVQSPVNFEDI
jgi:hypothetical protein